MKTKSRATAAAASTDAAAAVAERSNPRGIAKKRHGRFLPRALSSVLASLSKLKLGTRTAPVSSEKKAGGPVPSAKKPSSRAKRARSRRARRVPRPAPEPARKPAPGSEDPGARSSARPTRPGWVQKKIAETNAERALDAVDRAAKPARSAKRAKRSTSSVSSVSRGVGEKKTRRRAPASARCPSAPVVTTRAVMRRYARSAFARDFTNAERDALVQQGFPAVDTHGSVLDARRADAWAESDPEGEDDAWERGDDARETHGGAFDARDTILRAPVAWTPASPPRRFRGEPR